MKVDTLQQKAETWNKTLNKLNSSQEGQIQISYKNEQGQKSTGYISLLDISLLVEDKVVSLGELLTEMLNFNIETLKQVKTLAQGVESVGSDLYVVKTDDLGFIHTVSDLNIAKDLIIAKQPIPQDFNKGYYYVKNGLIILDEERKLDLFPDYV